MDHPQQTNGSRQNGRSQARPTTLGPVEDPEAHVPVEWWRHLFTGLYLKTDGDVVMDDGLTRQEVDTLEAVLTLRPSDRILDLCCGQGRHTLELAQRGYQQIEGLDRSHHLIQRGRRRAQRLGLAVRFREGDARRLPHESNSLDVILLMGNSFGYFDNSEDDLQVLREISRTLCPNGRVLIDISDGEHVRTTFEPRAWEWLDPKTFVCRERSLSRDGSRLISREVVTHSERGVIADQFYAERLYSREEIFALLERAGLRRPILHSELATPSRRNQDLGMMAQRLIISARAEAQRTGGHAAGAVLADRIAVVMGDPSIEDAVKPSSQFDGDDFDTIDRFKVAMDQLEGVSASYFNHHATLLADLSRQRDQFDFVFNLCDEGFGNKARQELHVPAALDLLGIPYTGAGPQCLAFCYDKALVRAVAGELGVPVAPGVLLAPSQPASGLVGQYPVIVKPNRGDSSVGITADSVANSEQELVAAIDRLRERLDHAIPILVERFLPGVDCTVGVIGNPPDDFSVLPIVEEDYSVLPAGLPLLCGYEAKWHPSSPYWQLRSLPADLPQETLATMRQASLDLFARLECQDYARFDWRLDGDGVPHLLEVNPNPGWCWDGHLAKMAALAGLSYSQLLGQILGAAKRRFAREALAVLVTR